MKASVDIEGPVAVVTFDGPGANLLTPPAFEEPIAVVSEVLARDDLGALVLRGAGRHFSAGADLEALERGLAGDEAGVAAELDAGKELVGLLTWAEVPTFAMIRGSCLGGGLELALACHFRVASENALLGFPESTLGLIPGLSGTLSAMDVLSRGVALDLLLTGRTVDGREALGLGLVDRVVPTRELEEATLEFVGALVGRRSPQLVRAVLTSIHNARRLDRDRALREEGRLFLEVARAKSLRGEDEGERR